MDRRHNNLLVLSVLDRGGAHARNIILNAPDEMSSRCALFTSCKSNCSFVWFWELFRQHKTWYSVSLAVSMPYTSCKSCCHKLTHSSRTICAWQCQPWITVDVTEHVICLESGGIQGVQLEVNIHQVAQGAPVTMSQTSLPNLQSCPHYTNLHWKSEVQLLPGTTVMIMRDGDVC